MKEEEGVGEEREQPRELAWWWLIGWVQRWPERETR
jgi:hypothetical protein